jgi:hypothetical protein
MSSRRAAIYGRVSTDWQTAENQTVALKEVAERRSWEVVEVYIDHAISGFPNSGRKFFRGIPLLPPLAGMRPRIILFFPRENGGSVRPSPRGAGAASSSE